MNIAIESDPISTPHFHRVAGVIGGRRTQQLQSAAARNVACPNLDGVDKPTIAQAIGERLHLCGHRICYVFPNEMVSAPVFAPFSLNKPVLR